MTNITWAGTATATSSISHGSDTRGLVTMLRRETIISDGHLTPIPLISGNSLRGRLRRIAEDLLRDTLRYDGQLTIAAAAALRSGGALAKTSNEPISGAKLAQLRHLVPLIGVFGTAGAGRIIDGCLQVGKLLPHAQETAALLDLPTQTLLPIADLTQIETYSRVDDNHRHAAATITDQPGSQLQYRIETFRAGTTFDIWLNLTNPTPLEASFFTDVIDTFTQHPTIAGRTAIGHGNLRLNLHRTGTTAPADWRTHITANTTEVIDALNQL